jgi:putative nucleotidyltransferase with HDIG domain
MIDLDALGRAAARLDPLPTSVTRLAALVCDAAPEIDTVVEIVEHDPALTGALLRAANSSWSAARREIVSVREATIRLGTGPVLSVALAANLRGPLREALPAYGLAEDELWEHSVAAFVAADEIASAATCAVPAAAATAALLHDVGKLVVARFVDDETAARLAAACDGGASVLEAERSVLGVDHAELGALVVRSWGLPGALVGAVRTHHRPGPGDLAAAVVHLADHVAHEVGPGGPAAGAEVDERPDGCDRIVPVAPDLGLASPTITTLRDRVAHRLEAVLARFG